MKWLLITVIKGNPGDLLIRRGVERLIRAVDPDAEFDALAKNDESTWAPRPFDRAVLCGMPLFWNEATTKTEHMPWWHLIMDWPTKDKRRFLALGVGSCCSSPTRAALAEGYIEQAASRMWRVILRDDYIQTSAAEVVCCPALFALDRNPNPTRKLFNIMPGAGHWPEFDPEGAKLWDGHARELYHSLHDAGWQLVVHNDILDFAQANEYAGDALVADTLDKVVAAYSDCAHYFGNRVHGAIATLSAGGHAWCVGNDSRRRAVNAAGGFSSKPGDEFMALADFLGGGIPDGLQAPRERDTKEHLMRDILREFAQ